MEITTKIIVTSLILWFTINLLAYPTTAFAKWGIKVFKKYTTFLFLIAALFIIPILITGLYIIWFKN